jgi:hypothetical protein
MWNVSEYVPDFCTSNTSSTLTQVYLGARALEPELFNGNLIIFGIILII